MLSLSWEQSSCLTSSIYLRQYDDDDAYIRIARNSDDFDDFCDRITDINRELNDALKILEPWLFDWRTAIAKVKIDCY